MSGTELLTQVRTLLANCLNLRLGTSEMFPRELSSQEQSLVNACASYLLEEKDLEQQRAFCTLIYSAMYDLETTGHAGSCLFMQLDSVLRSFRQACQPHFRRMNSFWPPTASVTENTPPDSELAESLADNPEELSASLGF